MARSVTELRRSRHEVSSRSVRSAARRPRSPATPVLEALAGRGKFENLNALLEQRRGRRRLGDRPRRRCPASAPLPGSLPAVRRALRPAARAARAAPHQPCGLAVVRRARWSVARRTRLVEIGPVTAFHRSVAGELLPFPRCAWAGGSTPTGAALALERGWRLGVVDATPSATTRAARPVATTATPRWRSCRTSSATAPHRACHRARGRGAVSLPVGPGRPCGRRRRPRSLRFATVAGGGAPHLWRHAWVSYRGGVFGSTSPPTKTHEVRSANNHDARRRAGRHGGRGRRLRHSSAISVIRDCSEDGVLNGKYSAVRAGAGARPAPLGPGRVHRLPVRHPPRAARIGGWQAPQGQAGSGRRSRRLRRPADRREAARDRQGDGCGRVRADRRDGRAAGRERRGVRLRRLRDGPAAAGADRADRPRREHACGWRS